MNRGLQVELALELLTGVQPTVLLGTNPTGIGIPVGMIQNFTLASK